MKRIVPPVTHRFFTVIFTFCVVALLVATALVFNRKRNNDDLTQAIRRGDAQAVSAALQRGANPNVIDPTIVAESLPPPTSKAQATVQAVRQILKPSEGDGWTMLILAARRGDLKAVKDLVKRGADPNAHTHLGVTPLSAAAAGGYAQIVTFLLQHGANCHGLDGNEALGEACRVNNAEIMRILLKAGADPNYPIPDYQNKVLLFNAVLQHSTACVAVLLQFGANPNIRLTDGETPLWFAVDNGDLAITKLLIAAKADVNVHYDDGTSLLYQARLNEHEEVVRALLSAGAKE